VTRSIFKKEEGEDEEGEEEEEEARSKPAGSLSGLRTSALIARRRISFVSRSDFPRERSLLKAKFA
jgi:hypothetical protein